MKLSIIFTATGLFFSRSKSIIISLSSGLTSFDNFGDTFTGGYSRAQGAICSSTRALFAGVGSPQSNNIEFITMSTLGNGTLFGDLPFAASARCAGRSGCSSVTRGLTAGGGSSDVSIDYISITTGGTAADFGDLTENLEYGAGCSNGHGGLG